MREKSWFRGIRIDLGGGRGRGHCRLILTASGNPKNMGFCIACFLRDIAGAGAPQRRQCAVHPAGDHRHRGGAAAAALAAREFRARPGPLPPAGLCWGCS